MLGWFSRMIDKASSYFAPRKGLLPLLGLLLILANLVIRLAFPGWLASSDLLLHLGIILAIIGFMLSWVL